MGWPDGWTIVPGWRTRSKRATAARAAVRVTNALHGPTGNKEPLVVGTLREHVRPGSNTDYTVQTPVGDDDPLLPLGLDSHRYRCCGNGVVANVAEWLGHRFRAALESAA